MSGAMGGEDIAAAVGLGEQERQSYMRSTMGFDQGSRLARVVAGGRATTDGSRSKRGRPERRQLQAPGGRRCWLVTQEVERKQGRQRSNEKTPSPSAE